MIQLFILTLLAVAVPQQSFSSGAQSEDARDLTELKKQTEASTELDAEAKKTLVGAIDEASRSIQKASELDAKIKANSELPDAAKEAEKVSADLQKLKDSLAKEKLTSAKSPEVVDDNSVSNEQLEKKISSSGEEVNRLLQAIEEIEREMGRRATQTSAAQTQSTEANVKRGQELQLQLESLPASDNSVQNQVARENLKSQLTLLAREADWAKVRSARVEEETQHGLLRLNRELLDNQLKRAQDQLSKAEKLKAFRAKKAADNSALEAEQQQSVIQKKFPLLVPSYEINSRYANRNKAVAERLSEVNTEKDLSSKIQQALQREYGETQAMINRIGPSGSVGGLLRRSKSELPNSQARLAAARKTKIDADEVQFEIFEIDRQAAMLSQESVKAEIIQFDSTQTLKSLDKLEKPIEALIQSRRELLISSRTNLVSLSDSLIALELNDRTISSVSAEFREYINELILWIRSNKVLFTELQIDSSDLKVVSPDAWKLAWTRMTKMFFGHPFLFALIGVAIALLLYLKQRFRSKIIEMGQIASRGSCQTFLPTIRTLLATILVSIAIPAIFLCFGLAIQYSEFNDGTTLFSAIGFASLAVAYFAFPFEFLRRMCREHGLAEKHFAWPSDAVRLLKSNLDWLNPIGGLIVFVIAVLQKLDMSHRVDLPERLFFVGGMLCMMLFLYKVAHPTHGIFQGYVKDNERAWWTQTAKLWFSAILIVPLAFAILAIVGYYYTALNLSVCVFATFVFAVVGETLRSLFLRYILVQRRHVHVTAAKRKRQVERDLREKERNVKTASLSELDDVKRAEVIQEIEAAQRLEASGATEEISTVDVNADEAKRLVSLGMWVIWGFALFSIWSDVLPALQALERPIFPPAIVSSNSVAAANSSNSEIDEKTNATADATSMMMPGSAPDSTANDSSDDSDISRMTYRDLLIFLVISGLTIAVARSLPSTLEMIFLERLPMDRSVRFAIRSLVSYGIILVGVLLAFRALQIGWSNVQWLATALTFGLAFGLQEIFANFVAGIILMFERPMRIGDWITIGDYSGTVKRIRTRATTLINLERKEFVIPNKDFIIGRLVNWTLSDAINRIDITVGVAYGSNVKQAKEILLKICKSHPRVVEDPASTVIFNEFGDSSLNLISRCFVHDIECRMAVIDQLHTQINDEFIDAGIEISFPQQDLHIRSASPELGDAMRGSDSANRDGNSTAVDSTAVDSTAVDSSEEK